MKSLSLLLHLQYMLQISLSKISKIPNSETHLASRALDNGSWTCTIICVLYWIIKFHFQGKLCSNAFKKTYSLHSNKEVFLSSALPQSLCLTGFKSAHEKPLLNVILPMRNECSFLLESFYEEHPIQGDKQPVDTFLLQDTVMGCREATWGERSVHCSDCTNEIRNSNV